MRKKIIGLMLAIACVFALGSVKDVSASTPSAFLGLHKVTETSLSVNVTYPYPGTWGNHLGILDTVTGIWSDFNEKAADVAPFRTNGTYTQTGLQKGRTYKIFMRWYDQNKQAYDYLPLIEITTLDMVLNQVSTTPATANEVVSVDVKGSNQTVLQKWEAGNKAVSYFAQAGNIFTGSTFEVSQNGVYTVYAKDAAGNEICRTIEIENILPRVLVIVDSNILNSLQNSLATYKDDLFNQGYNAIIESYTNDTNASGIPAYSENGNVDLLKNLIEARFASWSNPNAHLEGFVLIGDLPYAKVSKSENSTPALEQYCLSDWFLNDMNAVWSDSNNNGTLDRITGNMNPELWSGRIYSDSDTASITEYTNYFMRNHLYRTGVLAHSGTAGYLGTFDDTIQNRDALTALYTGSNVTFAQSGDPIAFISGGNYEWLDYIAHSNPWVLGDIDYNDVLTNDLNILFYNTHACSTARYDVEGYIAGRILFETDALEYIGLSCNGHYFPDQDAALKISLMNGNTFGEAFQDLISVRGNVNYSSETSIDTFLGQELGLYGDPTLKILQ